MKWQEQAARFNFLNAYLMNVVWHFFSFRLDRQPAFVSGTASTLHAICRATTTDAAAFMRLGGANSVRPGLAVCSLDLAYHQAIQGWLAASHLTDETTNLAIDPSGNDGWADGYQTSCLIQRIGDRCELAWTNSWKTSGQKIMNRVTGINGEFAAAQCKDYSATACNLSGHPKRVRYRKNRRPF